jgi:hypothetical protein
MIHMKLWSIWCGNDLNGTGAGRAVYVWCIVQQEAAYSGAAGQRQKS